MPEIKPLATVDDVVGIWGPLTDAEKSVAAELLIYATAKLMIRLARAGLDLDEVILDPAQERVATFAVASAVRRVLSNPRGAKQVSQTRGPFSDSWTIDAALASGALYIDDTDLEGLLPDTTTAGQIGSIRLYPGLA